MLTADTDGKQNTGNPLWTTQVNASVPAMACCRSIVRKVLDIHFLPPLLHYSLLALLSFYEHGRLLKPLPRGLRNVSPQEASKHGLPALPLSNLQYMIFPWTPCKLTSEHIYPHSLFLCIIHTLNVCYKLIYVLSSLTRREERKRDTKPRT